MNLVTIKLKNFYKIYVYISFSTGVSLHNQSITSFKDYITRGPVTQLERHSLKKR